MPPPPLPPHARRRPAHDGRPPGVDDGRPDRALPEGDRVRSRGHGPPPPTFLLPAALQRQHPALRTAKRRPRWAPRPLMNRRAPRVSARWDLAKSAQRLRDTLAWRASRVGARGPSCSLCERNPHAHNLYHCGFDKAGCPVIYSVRNPAPRLPIRPPVSSPWHLPSSPPPFEIRPPQHPSLPTLTPNPAPILRRASAAPTSGATATGTSSTSSRRSTASSR